MENELIEVITELVLKELNKDLYNNIPYIPVSVSARHIHLEKKHLEVIFGKNYELSKLKDISQPGQYASNEQVSLQGPKGVIKNVRILGPLRASSQVEISLTDARTLGLQPPLRASGDIKGSAPISLIGPRGVVNLHEGCIIAERHVHMTPQDAQALRLVDNQLISVEVKGPRGGVMSGVRVRAGENSLLDMHIDTDDANAFGIKGDELLKIVE